MFETFNRTEQSWGKAAHISPESLDKILLSGDSLKKIGPVNTKSHKAFKVWQTEMLSVERVSEPQIIYATSQDKVSQMARDAVFVPIPNEAYDKIDAILREYGYQARPRVTISSHRAT